MGGAAWIAGSDELPGRQRSAEAFWIAVATTGAVAVAVLLAATGAQTDRGWVALARGLIAGVPLGVGLYALHRYRLSRFGGLLVLTGVVCVCTTLAESGDATLYTIGRAAGWSLELLLVYLILAFPSGRLHARADRLIVAAMGLVLGLFYAPRLLLAEDFPVPSPYTSCAEDCPPNALFALSSEPAVVDGLLRPLGVLGVFLVATAVVARVAYRTRRESPLARRMHRPVLVVALSRVLLVPFVFGAQQLESSDLAPAAMWIAALAVPGIALGFGTGVMRWHFFRNQALRGLAGAAPTVGDARDLRATLARTLDDPSLAIAFPTADGRAWVDEDGRPVDPPDRTGKQAVIDIHDERGVVATVSHDPVLAFEPGLVQAAAAIAGAVLTNQRLTTESATAVGQVQRSRARVAAGAERERRRIERELRDGAEQRLAALRIQLPLVAAAIRHDPEGGLDRLHRLADDVEATLEDVRALAHGVLPPLLADRGLVPALRARTNDGPLRIELVARNVERYRPEVESAVYFCVLEILHLVAARAQDPGLARLVLDGHGDELRFTLRVNGVSAPPQSDTDGPCERLAAVGGQASVRATRGSGTLVLGRVAASDAALA